MALPDEINLGPVPNEVSSQPIFSSPSTAGAEMPDILRLFQKIDSERNKFEWESIQHDSFPYMVASAALQAGLGRHNYGFSDLTMEQVHHLARYRCPNQALQNVPQPNVWYGLGGDHHCHQHHSLLSADLLPYFWRRLRRTLLIPKLA